ncbi:alpha-1,3-mannosyl-glycoprotein 2-beta-N-acetylglucosaminyltransferase-like [Phragmites australis]|uniref:alpha-1,3-mannosyl-glycoprotein 2-beta-N-acetylglucosaminyltransferase-like n=1 Tax=Phragmites australis TaxID=29695 RepID=UPI002D797ACA|nr:alpha-1,3-mannosyl-glycoprotein 2-beta-N-acetylglucosaminyltransferase-like [Phragmites australis]XP_062212844.1 alpha-1,3-mannosyl-glycoprotein 2-beta-N-acetylglucosaminyltransferase-like [Phragmites australis]XP_062212851.1 alpha-1,3-mannosyl-glycoprotein 2-beta-N-acetylglucosaminyltransferase-like [Phragmites australis]XP_062212859.1 alpha-1,3-mannosyl-glycoprotein 2-beta-N-acetylglucosaminyltransferase-like [Phragmites australis]
MARSPCDLRLLLLAAAAAFIYIQVRLFATQSHYADRLAEAEKSENQCTSQLRSLIDRVSMQQEKIVALEDMKIRQDEERAQLKILIQDLEKRSVQNLLNKNVVPVAAVVIMACNRPDYLQRTVESILKYQTSVASKFPLFISQDGTNGAVKKKALDYKQTTYMQHVDLEPVQTERPGELTAYYKIAKHYKWALDELFIKHNFVRVIILEDDMEIAPDFFDYFEAAAKLLDNDKTIMAVSSWNDNGQKKFVNDPKALYRSDFFPGLGWMLTKSTWIELSPKWPKAYWDDWVRLKEVHGNRQFIRPEVCRTYNFGEHGSSMGQFFKQYLEPIRLNDVHIDWNTEDLSYLGEDKFLIQFGKEVASATPLHGSDAVLKAHNMGADVRIQYNDQEDFERIARQFGIFDEWKDGIPRTAYKGVVVFRYNSSQRRIFLVGPDSLGQLGV